MPGGKKQLITAGAAFAPLRWGLLSVAQEVPDLTDQWKLGTVYEAPPCAAATVTAAGCPPTTGSPYVTGAPKVPAATGAATSLTSAEPFTVVAWLPCSPIGQGDGELSILRTRTRQVMDRGEGRAVEHTFWTGDAVDITGPVSVRPHLAADTQVIDPDGHPDGTELQSAAVTVTGSPVDVVEAIGLLDEGLSGCYGGEGIVHVPRAALAHLAAWSLTYREGQTLRTPGGNLIAAYSPGDRTGPDGSDAGAGDAWFYATSPVFYRRGPVQEIGRTTGDVVGKDQNTTVFVLERTYVLDWDCCHFAAEVTLGGV